MQIQPYLFFNGRTEEAIDLYRRALDAKVEMLMRFRENPDPSHNPPGSDDKVMHACVRIGDSAVMVSDGMADGKPSFQGFSLTYNAKDEADAKRRFSALAEGGHVDMPLGETFFAKSFGMLHDRFGLGWMVIAGQKK
jgi:PhnB protein